MVLQAALVMLKAAGILRWPWLGVFAVSLIYAACVTISVVIRLRARRKLMRQLDETIARIKANQRQ
jgi:hypothetical protein